MAAMLGALDWRERDAPIELAAAGFYSHNEAGRLKELGQPLERRLADFFRLGRLGLRTRFRLCDGQVLARVSLLRPAPQAPH